MNKVAGGGPGASSAREFSEKRQTDKSRLALHHPWRSSRLRSGPIVIVMFKVLSLKRAMQTRE